MSKLPSNPPVPTVLKLIRGNPGKRPINKQEPKPKLMIPAFPTHLSAEAKREWRRVAKRLHAIGLLSEIDRAALALYCQAWGRWVEAERRLEKEGTVLRSPNNYPMLSPWLAVANKAMRQMHAMFREFGMSPSSRSQIKAGELGETSDPFDDLLRGA